MLIAGTTVKRASLHNADQIAAMDIRIGDEVLVEKGGEIIPKVVGVNTEARGPSSEPLVYITACPECGTALVGRRRGQALLPKRVHLPAASVGAHRAFC